MLRTLMRRLPRPLVFPAVLITTLVVQSVALIVQDTQIDNLRVQHVDLQAQGIAPGPSGPAGPSGPPGVTGPAGRNGQDGRNGANGRPGQNGRIGKNGKNGKNGKDGKDVFATPRPTVTVTVTQSRH
ncbi:hypothetical protein [Streptomyces sp. NPDC091217]|uniref:hypothetical protein n=1 Tax=Streptomyces sp. NPDC091217 TaxID=3365975 RepID=UPI003804EEB0